MSDNNSLLNQNFKRYLDKVIDQTRRNSLLNFRKSKKIILNYELSELVSAIQDENGLFFLEEDFKNWENFTNPNPDISNESTADSDEYQPPSLPYLNPAKLEGKSIKFPTLLDDIRLSTARDKSDYGIDSLFITIGTISWSDSRFEDKDYEAPILLIPTEMKRKRENGYRWIITPHIEGVLINPALQVVLENQYGAPNVTIKSCMSELDIDTDAEDDVSIESIYEAVSKKLSKVLKPKSGVKFDISQKITLSKHRFQNYHIYEDLKANQEEILASDLIQGMLNESDLSEKFSVMETAEERVILSPEEDFSVMNSDASQQAVISKASQGQSLIVQGPPGTGKSQTITNLISNLVARGKSVLFICDKKVALQVVERNLKKSGISDVVLPLYNGADDKKSTAKVIVNIFAQHSRISDVSDKISLPLKKRKKYLEALYKYRDFLESPISDTELSIKEVLFALDMQSIEEIACSDFLYSETFNEDDLKIVDERFTEAFGKHMSSKILRETFGERKCKNIQIDSSHTQKLKASFLKAQTQLNTLNIPDFTRTTDWDLASLNSVLELVKNRLHEIQTFSDLLSNKDSLGDASTALNDSWSYITILHDITNADAWIRLKKSDRESITKQVSRLENVPQGTSIVDLCVIENALTIVSSNKNVISRTRAFTLRQFEGALTLAQKKSGLPLIDQFNIGSSDLRRIRMLMAELSSVARNLEELETKFFGYKIDLKNLSEDGRSTLDALKKVRIILPFGRKYSHAKALVGKITLTADKKISYKKLKDVIKMSGEYTTLQETKSRLTDAINVQDFLSMGTLELTLYTSYLDQALSLCEETRTSWQDLLNVLCEMQSLKERGTILLSNITKLFSYDLGIANEKRSTQFIGYIEGLDTALSDDISGTEKILGKFNELSLEGVAELLESNDRCRSLESKILETFAKNNVVLTGKQLAGLVSCRDTLNDFKNIELSIFGNLSSGQVNNLAGLDLAAILDDLTKLSSFVEDHVGMLDRTSLETFAQLTSSALEDWDRFIDYCDYSEFLHWCDGHALKPVVKYLEQHNDTDNWGQFARLATCFYWIANQTYFNKTGSYLLAELSGEKMRKIVKGFQETDAESIENNSDRVLARYRTGLSEVTHIPSILRRESNKKRQLKPVNQLVKEAGDTMQAIKPVWMMNPSTVSMHFSQARLKFDCVIFDEASQIRLEHAFSGMSLADQVIVLGDQHQLPPTSFFETMDGDHEDETDDYQYEDLISASKTVLGITHEATLRYHYRSKYEELIAFSNHFVYEDKLITFPNPKPSSPIELHYVEDGICVEGQNDVEAQRVVEVCKKIADDPKNQDKSIGVIALSKRQENAIREAFHAFISKNLDYEIRFGEEVDDVMEPFFIKNLENVQGDERDIIILSTGYGKSTDGNVYQRFGPINTAQGYRRLNVAVTRARQKMVCVTSLRPSNITEGTNRGRQMLKQFLSYCEHGKDILNTQSIENSGIEDSQFEISVREALEARGLVIDAQVGVSGYRIDLAVKDTESNRYLIGIECDGSVYHSSYSARVNDRIRESHLRNLGWDIYRIWSYDWANHREDVIEEILALASANMKSNSK